MSKLNYLRCLITLGYFVSLNLRIFDTSSVNELHRSRIHPKNFFDKSSQTNVIGQIIYYRLVWRILARHRIHQDFTVQLLLKIRPMSECMETIGQNSRWRVESGDHNYEHMAEQLGSAEWCLVSSE